MAEEKSGVPRWVLPLALGVVVVALVAIALLRGPVVLNPDSPEGTVQEYLVALDEERWEDVVAVVHPDWLGACTGDDVALFSPGDFEAELGFQASGFDSRIVRSEDFTVLENDGEPPPAADTTVEVTIIHDGGGGLGSGWNEQVVFELVDDGEFWWIVSDPWPYFVWNCREG